MYFIQKYGDFSMNVQYNKDFCRIAGNIKIDVLEAGLSDLGEDWRSQDVCSPYSRLYYVLSGTGYLRTYDTDGAVAECYTMQAGHLYLIPNGLCYDYFCEEHFRKVHFHINVWLQNGLELFFGCNHCYALPVSLATLENMQKWITSDAAEDYFHMQAELYHAIAAFMQPAAVQDKANHVYSDLVMRLFSLLPGMKISTSVKDISQIMNVSESTLAKHFKKETGMSIGTYREQLVMGRARQLLALGTLSVKDISDEFGFCDQFYFSRYFKAHQGITPSAYRQRYSLHS